MFLNPRTLLFSHFFFPVNIFTVPLLLFSCKVSIVMASERGNEIEWSPLLNFGDLSPALGFRYDDRRYRESPTLARITPVQSYNSVIPYAPHSEGSNYAYSSLANTLSKPSARTKTVSKLAQQKLLNMTGTSGSKKKGFHPRPPFIGDSQHRPTNSDENEEQRNINAVPISSPSQVGDESQSPSESKDANDSPSDPKEAKPLPTTENTAQQSTFDVEGEKSAGCYDKVCRPNLPANASMFMGYQHFPQSLGHLGPNYYSPHSNLRCFDTNVLSSLPSPGLPMAYTPPILPQVLSQSPLSYPGGPSDGWQRPLPTAGPEYSQLHGHRPPNTHQLMPPGYLPPSADIGPGLGAAPGPGPAPGDLAKLAAMPSWCGCGDGHNGKCLKSSHCWMESPTLGGELRKLPSWPNLTMSPPAFDVEPRSFHSYPGDALPPGAKSHSSEQIMSPVTVSPALEDGRLPQEEINKKRGRPGLTWEMDAKKPGFENSNEKVLYNIEQHLKTLTERLSPNSQKTVAASGRQPNYQITPTDNQLALNMSEESSSNQSAEALQRPNGVSILDSDLRIAKTLNLFQQGSWSTDASSLQPPQQSVAAAENPAAVASAMEGGPNGSALPSDPQGEASQAQHQQLQQATLPHQGSGPHQLMMAQQAEHRGMKRSYCESEEEESKLKITSDQVDELKRERHQLTLVNKTLQSLVKSKKESEEQKEAELVKKISSQNAIIHKALKILGAAESIEKGQLVKVLIKCKELLVGA